MASLLVKWSEPRWPSHPIYTTDIISESNTHYFQCCHIGKFTYILDWLHFGWIIEPFRSVQVDSSAAGDSPCLGTTALASHQGKDNILLWRKSALMRQLTTNFYAASAVYLRWVASSVSLVIIGNNLHHGWKKQRTHILLEIVLFCNSFTKQNKTTNTLFPTISLCVYVHV